MPWSRLIDGLEKIKPIATHSAMETQFNDISYTQLSVVMEHVTEQLNEQRNQEVEQVQRDRLDSNRHDSLPSSSMAIASRLLG